MAKQIAGNVVEHVVNWELLLEWKILQNTLNPKKTQCRHLLYIMWDPLLCEQTYSPNGRAIADLYSPDTPDIHMGEWASANFQPCSHVHRLSNQKTRIASFGFWLESLCTWKNVNYLKVRSHCTFGLLTVMVLYCDFILLSTYLSTEYFPTTLLRCLMAFSFSNSSFIITCSHMPLEIKNYSH